MALPIRRPYRLLMITFDLTSTIPGDPRYDDADRALKSHGLIFRPIKQLRLIITRSTSARIKASLDQQIGRSTSVFITPITSIPAWRIHGAAKRREWRDFNNALLDHGIIVRYASSNSEYS